MSWELRSSCPRSSPWPVAICLIRQCRQPSAWSVEFSDAALDWAEAWLEGRFDLMQEAGWQERDGPYKLRCELCGQRSWLNYFAWTVERAEGQER